MKTELYQEMYELEQYHWWFKARREIIVSLIATYISNNTSQNTDPKNIKVLDVGCGTGFILENLQRLGYDGRGLDSSAVAVEFCEQKGLNTVIKGVLTRGLPELSEQVFDMITFLDVLEHIDEDLDLLITAKQYLNQNGYILITVPAYRFLWSSHDVAHGHKRRYLLIEVLELCHQAGYEVSYISYFNTFLFPLVAIARIVGKLRKTENAVKNRSDAKAAPVWINGLLEKIFGWEQYLLPKFTFPFGVSIVCVARLRTIDLAQARL